MNPGLEGEAQESFPERAWRTGLVLLVSAAFTLNYGSVRPLAALDEYAAGKADIPFRVLPILLMRGAKKIVLFQKVASHLPTAPRSTDELVLLLSAFFGMLAAVWCTGKTMESLGLSRRLADWVRLLVAIMSFFNLTPAWGLNYTLPYDVPSLAFFSCGVWLLVSRRMVWFYPLFALATLNKETTCFLVIFFIVFTAVEQGDQPHIRRYIALHTGALTAVWLVVKLVPTHLFHGHAFSVSQKGLFLHRLLFNLEEVVKPQQWPVLASVCGFTLPLVWLWRRWIGHRAFAYAAGITIAAGFLGGVLQGLIIEIRIFADWAALITPCLGLMIMHRLAASGEYEDVVAGETLARTGDKVVPEQQPVH